MLTFTTGDIIRRIRKQQGLSQHDLAQKIGVNDNSIHMIENEPRDVYFKTICKIADGLNVSLDDLRPVTLSDLAIPKDNRTESKSIEINAHDTPQKPTEPVKPETKKATTPPKPDKKTARETAFKYWQDGGKVYNIHKELGISGPTAYTWEAVFQEHNAPFAPKSKFLTREIRQQAFDLWQNGKRGVAISDALNIQRATIYKWQREFAQYRKPFPTEQDKVQSPLSQKPTSKDRHHQNRQKGFELWKNGEDLKTIRAECGISDATSYLWQSIFKKHNAPFPPENSQRKCNLCPKMFTPQDKFERYCKTCKYKANETNNDDF